MNFRRSTCTLSQFSWARSKNGRTLVKLLRSEASRVSQLDQDWGDLKPLVKEDKTGFHLILSRTALRLVGSRTLHLTIIVFITSRGPCTTVPRPHLACCLFYKWSFIRTQSFVYDCFWLIMTDLSSGGRAHVACKAELRTFWPMTERVCWSLTRASHNMIHASGGCSFQWGPESGE